MKTTSAAGPGLLIRLSALTAPGRARAPLVLPVAALLTNENCFPTNRAVDPGEQVTFSFSLRNIGMTNTATGIATLLATNGVLSPGAAQNYGVLSSNGTSVSRQFTFTASGSCRGVISPTLQIQDGSSNRGTVSFSMSLGAARGLVQNFDGVTAPALPGTWSNSASGGATGWETVTSDFHTPSNSVLPLDPDELSDCSLDSPFIPIVTATVKLSFAHWYTTEPEFDCSVLEISINNGAYADILAAGGSFLAGGYNGTIDSGFGNPLEDGRAVWTGDSPGFITTVVNLPASVAGQNIRLRWRLASDISEGGYGWNVDTVTVEDGYTCCQGSTAPLIVETRRTNNNIVFSFNTVPGQSYVTEYKGALSTNLGWTPWQTNAGDGTKKSVTNSAAAATNRFFRVKTQ